MRGEASRGSSGDSRVAAEAQWVSPQEFCRLARGTEADAVRHRRRERLGALSQWTQDEDQGDPKPPSMAHLSRSHHNILSFLWDLKRASLTAGGL